VPPFRFKVAASERGNFTGPEGTKMMIYTTPALIQLPSAISAIQVITPLKQCCDMEENISYTMSIACYEDAE